MITAAKPHVIVEMDGVRLIKTYKPPENIQEIIDTIDVDKLSSERVNSLNPTYTQSEIKSLAKSLGLPTSGNKTDLVNRISDIMREYGSSNITRCN